jgi:hypothetical protein
MLSAGRKKSTYAHEGTLHLPTTAQITSDTFWTGHVPLNKSHSISTSQTQPAKNKFWCSFFSFTQLTATSDTQNAYMNQHTRCCICMFASSFINISSYMWVSSSVRLISTTQYILNSFQTLHYLHFPFPLLILLGQSKNKHYKPSQNMWSISVLT